ncbi:unnamed protein product [Symbiodinium sp. KB8]|nr:unnamed protein product [Symbiodinium sp. KB8]
MGRGRKPWKDEAQSWGPNVDQIWRGAWSPQLRGEYAQRPWRAPASSPAVAPKAAAFPAYTSMPQREATGSVLAMAPTRPTGRVQSVQGLLNLARKAEVKLAKLEKSKTRAQAQWQAFQEGLKDSYLREQARFQKHTAQLEADIAEASVEQEKAFQVVRQAFVGDSSGAMQIDADGQSAEERWTQMRSSWEQEDDAYLRDIINGRPGVPAQARTPAERMLSPEIQQLLAHFGAQCFPGGGCFPAAMVAPNAGTPPGLSGVSHVPQGATPTPTTTSMPPPHMTTDPGQADGAGPVGHVPSPAPMEGLGADGHPPSAEADAELPAEGPTGPAGHKARRALGQSGLPVRQTIKTHTKPTSPLAGRPALAEKLAQKREAALVGLQSGGIVGPADIANAGAGLPTATGPIQSGEPHGPIRYEIQEDDDSDSDLELKANEVPLILDLPPLAILTAPDLPASAVDTPGSDHFASSVSCIGVTVHAPYFPSVVLNFIADKDEGLGALITSIQQLDCLPCPAHDCMVDLKPQRHTGFISLLSYPSILDRMDPPLRAVMFDLSCVGGHLHARVLPRCVSWDNLAAVVCRLINVDIFEEAVTIWVGADQIILDRRTPYHLCHGDVLVFLRSHLGPPIGLAASSFFQHGIEWHRECHPTVSPIATCEAVCDCDRVFTVDMSYFRPLSPEDTALRQSRVSATDHQVTKVTVSPPLNLDGEICVSIYVVTPKQAPAGTTADSTTVPAARYLLDLRILGLMPKLVLGQPTIHDLPDILRAAGIALPSHLCGTLVSNRLFDQVQVLTIGIGPELASSVMCFPALRWPVPEAIPADPIVHSAPPHGAPGAGHFQRFDRELPVPDPHLVLNLIEDEVTVFDAISYDAGFIVLIPDFVAERVQVRLSTTCTVEEALSDVAETRDTLAAVHFEQLVPVFPQPDPSFACVLALPMWGLHSRIGVFDTRAVDGRLFALALTERLNRASILLHAGLPVVDTFQVFIGDEPTDVHRWFPLHQGVLITILPSDFAFHHGGSLEARLSRDTGWAIPCPSFGGIEGPKFSILSDGLGAVLRVDLDVVTSSAFFKAEAARLFRFDSEKVTVCPSVPRLRNVSVRGDDCDALIVATESICRIPVPPGRPQAPNGVLDYEHFLRSLHDLAPPGSEQGSEDGDEDSESSSEGTSDHPSPGATPLTAPNMPAPELPSSTLNQLPSLPVSNKYWTTFGRSRCCLYRISESSGRWEWILPLLGYSLPCPGTDLACTGIPALTELLPVDSGAVLVLYYEDAGLAQAFPMQSAPPATTATPVVSEEQSAPAQSSDMRPPVAQDSYEDLDLGDAAVEASVTGAQAALGPRAHFLILAPEYGPDLVSLNTEFPISVDEVLTQVADLRDPALANRFPQLLPVHIQPAISFACLLALPSWEFAGVPILIVCYVPPFRVMTVVVGALLAPDDILRLVGVPDDGTAQVFYADMPWAIPSGRQVDVQPGALFTVVPIGQPRIPPVTLPAILASVNGWHYDPVLPGPFTGAVWVLTDTGHFRLSYDFRPDLDLPEAMSYIAGVDRADLTILPAHPPVHDHYHQGTPLRQVFMSLADLDEDGVPFFLDQRPVLSTIVWMVARGGRVDVATVCGIHAARCPPTHFVRLLGGFAPPGTANHQRFVYPGQVLTVEFQFRRSYYAAGQMPDDNDSSDGSSSDEGGDGSDEDDGPWPDAAATSSNTASSLPDAGTGSTQGCGGAAITQTLSCEDQRVGRLRWATLFGAFCRFCKDAWSEGMDTCLPGLMHDVHHVDSPGFTSAFPCNAFLWDCLEHIFLVLVWVPVWVCACLGQCGLGYPTDGRKSRAILTALIVLYQFDLCSATAELTRVPDRTSAPQGVQCLSNVDHSARRVIATPCRSCHPAPPVSMHSCDSSQETPLGLDRASYGRARRDGSSPAEAPRRDRSTVGSADREKSADTDLVDCVNGPTLLEAVPTGDKLWAWFNAVTLIETLEEHFSDVPPQESHGATEVRQQISLAEVIPLSAFQGQALSLHDLLPGMSDHYQRPEELLDWLDNDLRGVTSDPAVLALLGYLVLGLFPFGMKDLWVLMRTILFLVSSSTDLSMYVCYLRQLAHSRTTLTHRHVKAHAGCTANELCDELAKRARRTPAGRSGDILPVWPGRLFAHPLKSWAWLPSNGSADLPSLFSFESEAGRLQAIDPVGESGPTLGRRQTRSSKTPNEFSFCFITANILTLLDPGRGGIALDSVTQPGLRIVAKRELLKQQFLQEGALLIGIQETRLQETATLPDGQFVMLHAAADGRGHYGVALWANTTIPYAHRGETQWFLTRNHFTVVECQPRLLIVSVRAPFLSWIVVVAHAPSEPPAPEGSAAAFWFSCKKVLSRCSRDAEVILLADANARVGGLTSDSVGPHGAEEESKTAPEFHQFLAETSLQLPSTFAGCHQGICHTWTSPMGIRHRIDYIAVPFSWPLSCVQTHVWDTFEALQLRDDHFPLVLKATLACRSRDDSSVCFSRAAVRPSKDADPSLYIAGITQVLSSRPVTWQEGVDSHYAHLATEWTRWGRTLCQFEERKPRQSYLTAATLQLVAWRKAWRSQLHVWKQWHRSRTLAICFLLWRSEIQTVALGQSGISGLCIWADQFLLCIAQAALLLYRVGRHIKSSAKSDRAAYLDKLAHEVTLSDLKDPKLLYQRVRRAFPASRTGKRSQFCPLPAVYNSNGELAHSTSERQECWRQHFATQEAGDLIEDSVYPTELRRQRSTVNGRGTVFDIRCVPTLADVEQTILGLQPGKATGSDGISAELLRVHAPTSARLLAAVYVKSALAIYEPVEFRGGSLIPLAKRAAAAFSMDKFRSILVSSLPGKVLHRQYRTALIPPLQQVRGDLQAGALPSISTEAIIMAARTFRDIMVHRRHAWSLTFFDVRAAYYRVLRQILVKTGDQEWALRKLLHELGVPPQALQELAQKMDSIGILADAGVPEHLCHLLADAMQGTWFRIDCGTALTLTRRGVRPGDCLADVLFSFTFSAYLASTGEALRGAGVCTDMPQVNVSPPWKAPSLDKDLSCASWADDFVHLAAQLCHKTIATRVTRVVEIFVGQADSIGMQLTFATDKTATMLSHASVQDGPVQEDADGQFLNVVSPVTGTCHRLPVVSAYRHLGGIATVSGTPAPEIGFRHSLALKVVRPLRSRLFSAYGIPFPTRCLLLRSLVMSRYMFGSAALSLHTAVHKRLWAKHFVALWRVLWRRRPGEHSRHSYAVLGSAQAPTPPLALALARAVLFRQLLASGPSSLLHLLFVHWTESPRHAWLGMLLEDVQHVAQYLPEVKLAEASVSQVAKQIRKGNWGAYATALPALQAFGPRQLTSRERLALSDEDLDLGLISRMFFPDPVFQDHRCSQAPSSSRINACSICVTQTDTPTIRHIRAEVVCDFMRRLKTN